MDRLTSLAVFVKVVDSQGFAAAAREIGLSPAMASKHIQALEERLGARLLNRTTRRLSLTEAGRSYYERCRRILAELDEADRAVDELQETPRGLLRINAPLSFGTRHIGPAVADYLTACPEVALEVALDDRVVDLLEEGADLALRIGQLADSSLIARRLTPIRLVLCAAPDYLARRGTPLRPRDLAQHECLDYAYAATPGEWQFLGPGGQRETVRITGRLVANNGDVLRCAALAGAGIALGPSFILGEDVAAGRLVPLLRPGFEPPESALYAVYPHGRFVSAKLRSFIDFLVARFGEEPDWDRWRRAPIAAAG
jgi:DNA-binding transcriptional LysR family regulator